MKTRTLNVIALHCVVGNENYHRPCVYHIEIMLDKMWLMNNKEQNRVQYTFAYKCVFWHNWQMITSGE